MNIDALLVTDWLLWYGLLFGVSVYVGGMCLVMKRRIVGRKAFRTALSFGVVFWTTCLFVVLLMAVVELRVFSETASSFEHKALNVLGMLVVLLAVAAPAWGVVSIFAWIKDASSEPRADDKR